MHKSSAFLLKCSDGNDPPAYTTVAGLRTTSFSIRGEAVPIPRRTEWQELIHGAGMISVSVAGAGVFTGSAAEARIKASAISGVIDDYELSFENGERIRGKFLITRLDYNGDFNEDRWYTVALESSGQVVML